MAGKTIFVVSDKNFINKNNPLNGFKNSQGYFKILGSYEINPQTY